MSRHVRLHDFRFVGDRRTMVVYDTDDAAEAASLASGIAESDLIGRLLVQTFAPDTLLEARNRGFRPVGGRSGAV